MAEITGPQIAEAVAKTIPALFTDTVEQLRVGEANYIASGEPEGLVAKVGQAVARAACRQFGGAPGDAPALNSIRFEEACRPYLDQLSPQQGLGINVPFEGGQCPSLYRLFGDVEFETFVGSLSQTFQSRIDVTGEYDLLGPIGGFSFRYDTPGSNGNRRWIMDVGTGTGTVVGYRSFLNPSSDSAVSGARFTGSVEVVPGQPNNCGNPAPVPVQPRPIPDGNPAPFRFIPSPGESVDVDVRINPDGTITFNIGTGDVTVDPFGLGEGDGDAGPSLGDIGATVSPTSPGLAGDDQNTSDGGGVEGEAPEGEELTGLLVTVLTAPQSANKFDNVSALVYRGVGYVSMGYPGLLGVDTSAAVVNSPQFFHAQQRGLTAWRVRANVGFNLRVTPYYREIAA